MGKSQSRIRGHGSAASVPVNGRYVGLENFGNTCYFNSVIQVLYHCDLFRKAVLDEQQDKNNQESLLTALCGLFELISTNKRKTSSLRPKKFYERLRKDNELFNCSMQQDAQEFLNYLLNTLSDILRKNASDSNDGSSSSSGDSGSDTPSKTWVEDLFEGRLANETRCMCCETVTNREEAFLNLSIEITPNSSVSSCLRQFSSVEPLRGDSKYSCDTCCSYQEAEKRMRIKELPKVLAIHLKRFRYNTEINSFTKLSERVVFPFELRLFNTTDDAESADQVYDLLGAVIHVGSQLSRGHYISIVKHDGTWLLFDDAAVQPIDESEISEFFGKTDSQQQVSKSSESAYILFYEARRKEVQTSTLSPPQPGPTGRIGLSESASIRSRNNSNDTKRERGHQRSNSLPTNSVLLNEMSEALVLGKQEKNKNSPEPQDANNGSTDEKTTDANNQTSGTVEDKNLTQPHQDQANSIKTPHSDNKRSDVI
eukprot:m.92343 g.92343  ORF g.92343 m.92343 type:complete len:483 (+) comp13347_c0_seq2:281-1729(+)